jgi:hypothetical protein
MVNLILFGPKCMKNWETSGKYLEKYIVKRINTNTFCLKNQDNLVKMKFQAWSKNPL